MIKKICIISQEYPSPGVPKFDFVDKLVCEFVEQGIECVVIAPQSITHNLVHKQPKREFKSERKTKNGKPFLLYSPSYISLSRGIGGIKTSKFTSKGFCNAVLRTYYKFNISADAIYAHFIAFSGTSACALSKKTGTKFFIGNGESSLSTLDGMEESGVKECLKKASGIISASAKNKTELLESRFDYKYLNDKIIVLPNAIDSNVFYKIDKIKARKELGLPQNHFITAFVGAFNDRKGSLRLASACDELPDVYSLFIGSGTEDPRCKNILFKGRVDNKKIYKYLNSADVFVLPTLAEGCCNAIVEAMACGLPVISSDLSFNDDILSEENSIRIDPNNIEEIKNSIIKIKEDQAMQRRMSVASLKLAENLNIQKRVEKILAFMNGEV